MWYCTHRNNVWCHKAATQDHSSTEPEPERSVPEVFSFPFELSFSFSSPGSVIANQRTLICIMPFTNNFVQSLILLLLLFGNMVAFTDLIYKVSTSA